MRQLTTKASCRRWGNSRPTRLVQRDSRELTRYRVLCLVALERTVEAERAMEEMLMRDPLYSISAGRGVAAGR